MVSAVVRNETFYFLRTSPSVAYLTYTRMCRQIYRDTSVEHQYAYIYMRGLQCSIPRRPVQSWNSLGPDSGILRYLMLLSRNCISQRIIHADGFTTRVSRVLSIAGESERRAIFLAVSSVRKGDRSTRERSHAFQNVFADCSSGEGKFCFFSRRSLSIDVRKRNERRSAQFGYVIIEH